VLLLSTGVVYRFFQGGKGDGEEDRLLSGWRCVRGVLAKSFLPVGIDQSLPQFWSGTRRQRLRHISLESSRPGTLR
jgi:hypothetical protein